MGGIWKMVPLSYAFMWISSLALAGIGIPGIFGFAGHYSKDIILEATWAANSGVELLRVLAWARRRLYDGILFLATALHDLPWRDPR